jgi:hypothetical protein
VVVPQFPNEPNSAAAPRDETRCNPVHDIEDSYKRSDTVS